MVFFFKQKTAYEMRISDWSSDVCSSDLVAAHAGALQARVAHGRAHDEVALAGRGRGQAAHVDDLVLAAAQAVVLEADHVGQLLEVVDHAQVLEERLDVRQRDRVDRLGDVARPLLHGDAVRSEEHTSELQSLMRISYAVFCLKKKK